MDKELQDLKSVLRSLVVSSPAQVDVRSLARDYRSMMGGPIPIADYGYRDILAFLKERCADCFLGLPSNPVLTLIVPESLKHIDQFVQRQKCTAVTKVKGKRRSVQIPSKRPEQQQFERSSNRICETFQNCHVANKNVNHHPLEMKSNHAPEVKSGYPRTTPERQSNHHSESKSNYHYSEVKTNENQNDYNTNINSKYSKLQASPPYHPQDTMTNKHLTRNNSYTNNMSNAKEVNQSTHSIKQDCKVNSYISSEKNDYESKVNLMKRLKGLHDSAMDLNSEACSETEKAFFKEENDSGRQTSSSRSSTKKAQLEEVKNEVYELIKSHENGILCADILRLYRERYGRELELSRAPHHNINGLLDALEERVAFAQEPGGVRVRRAAAAPPPRARPAPVAPPPRARPAPVAPPPRARPAPVAPPPRARPAPAAPPPRPRPAPAAVPRARLAPPVDPDDALPGLDFEPDVFPEDCMNFLESIPALPLDDVGCGAMLEVAVGEVYSPSHFWLQRLGPAHADAMHQIMDEMSEYYTRGEGRERALAPGAVRVGHYCASLYERDWHRSLIVKILDGDTVKVRHVDYGTVDTAAAAALKPLLRRWSALPAQAARARLAGLRPGAGGRRWPHAAAAAFLRLVQDQRFIANVVAVDREEATIETFLIDTRGAEDACVSAALVRAGHGEARADRALRSGDSYLFPVFAALESGATPNYAEIHRYLADGISLDCVEAYRRHVPAALPPADPAPAARPEPPSLPLGSSVALVLPCSGSGDAPESPDDAPTASPAGGASPAHTGSGTPPTLPGGSAPAARPSGNRPPIFSNPGGPPPVPFGPAPPAPFGLSSPASFGSAPQAPFGPSSQAPFGSAPQAPFGPSSPAPFGSAPPAPFGFVPPAPFGPAPPGYFPAGSFGPPPPGYFPAGGDALLSVAECQLYAMLDKLDPAAAQCYMLTVARRARPPAARPAGPPAGPPAARPAGPPAARPARQPAGPPLNPHAPEFRALVAPTDLPPRLPRYM